jgi:ribonuclease HI
MKSQRLTSKEISQLNDGKVDPAILGDEALPLSSKLDVINDETSETAGQLEINFVFTPKGAQKPSLANNDVSSTTVLTEVKLYTDGGSRGNPGPAASGWVLFDLEDNIIKENGYFLGTNTNNVAEYTALKKGLEDAQEMGAVHVQVFMDSLLIVNQIKGLYKIKSPELRPIYDDVKRHLDVFEKVTFTHIPRALNKEADRLVNETLDKELGL